MTKCHKVLNKNIVSNTICTLIQYDVTIFEPFVT